MRALYACVAVLSLAAPVSAWEFCWLEYPHAGKARQGGWRTDYPAAGWNLSLRVEELTTATLAPRPNSNPLQPFQRVVTVTEDDPDWSHCPLLYTQDVASMALDKPALARLHRFFARGGILWIDDSWGWSARQAWEATRARLLPQAQPLETLPAALRRALYALPPVPPQVVDEGTWQRGGTRETKDAVEPVLTVYVDRQTGAVQLIEGWDLDFGDSWERETNPQYFEAFAVPGYAWAVNVLLFLLAGG